MTECLNVPGTVLISTGRSELDQGPVLQMPRAFGRSKHTVYNTKYYREEKRTYICIRQGKNTESSQGADP